MAASFFQYPFIRDARDTAQRASAAALFSAPLRDRRPPGPENYLGPKLRQRHAHNLHKDQQGTGVDRRSEGWELEGRSDGRRRTKRRGGGRGKSRRLIEGPKPSYAQRGGGGELDPRTRRAGIALAVACGANSAVASAFRCAFGGAARVPVIVLAGSVLPQEVLPCPCGCVRRKRRQRH